MLRSDTTGPYAADDGATAPVTWSEVSLEAEILAILDRSPEPGERLEFAFRRKEAELLAAFDKLTVLDARELRRRLALALPGDPIAVRFARLIPQRRARLIAFLDDARRREALRSARR
jgi:hypothetical protein